MTESELRAEDLPQWTPPQWTRGQTPTITWDGTEPLCTCNTTSICQAPGHFSWQHWDYGATARVDRPG